MRRLFTTLVLLAATVAALGYCREWFTISTAEHSFSDQVDISVRIDKSRIRADARQAKEQARALRNELVDIFSDRDDASWQEIDP